MIKKQQLLNLFPNIQNSEIWETQLNKYFEQFHIDSKERVSAFLATCGHESQYFTRFEENLNYSSDGLLRTFKKYFKNLNPDEYARNPEKIANVVYSGRIGNGDLESGDGWKYRGRGIIQITGRFNYGYFESLTGIPVVDQPDLINSSISTMILSACIFWEDKNLIQYNGDIKTITKIVNGGYNGLDDRQKLYEKIYRVL